MTHSRQDIARLLADSGLSPRRAFGQNFVADPNTVRRITRLAHIGPDDFVVEIGAGLGSLTLALAETGARVVAIEIDRGIVSVLRRVVADLPNVTVIEADARALDWNSIIPSGRTAIVVANLPYNVATPLIADLLDTVPAISRLVVMVQREVALRLAASPGSADYGAVSVKVAYWATAHVLGDVPATVFVPRPKVTSSIIDIARRSTPAVDVDPQDLFPLVRTAFGQRRKMLRRSLAHLVTAEEFRTAGIDDTARPEDLDVIAWGRLARAVKGEVVRAPAKLTLELRVTGVREDGYHLIDAVMTSLDLCDVLHVRSFGSQHGQTRVSFTGPHADGIADDGTDLVTRALHFVGRRAHVTVVKNIPHGGGLGGGSTDAAAVLRWAERTSPEDIMESAELGADVPFCVTGGRAEVSGIGEIVRARPYEHQNFTLVVPPVHVSTPAVYRAWDQLGGPRGDNGNDLEPAALLVEPLLAAWRDRIQQETGKRPKLAGSGATWFLEGHYPVLVDVLTDADVHLVSTLPSEP